MLAAGHPGRRERREFGEAQPFLDDVKVQQAHLFARLEYALGQETKRFIAAQRFDLRRGKSNKRLAGVGERRGQACFASRPSSADLSGNGSYLCTAAQ